MPYSIALFISESIRSVSYPGLIILLYLTIQEARILL
jgi:hypothetical protein